VYDFITVCAILCLVRLTMNNLYKSLVEDKRNFIFQRGENVNYILALSGELIIFSFNLRNIL